MDLKLLCYLVHCWHHILMLFHFGRMYSFCNQNCYLNCYCNQKIFHFGRVLQILCSHSPPHCWIGFLFSVDGLQVCLHYCKSRSHWSWYQSLSLRIFLFGRVCHSGKLQYFLQSTIFSVIVLFISCLLACCEFWLKLIVTFEWLWGDYGDRFPWLPF